MSSSTKATIAYVIVAIFILLGSVAAVLDDKHPQWTLIWAISVLFVAGFATYGGVMLGRMSQGR